MENANVASVAMSMFIGLLLTGIVTATGLWCLQRIKARRIVSRARNVANRAKW